MDAIVSFLGLKPKPEEKEDYQHVDTGDSLKVKQVLDEATVKAVLGKNYEELHRVDNMKIALMVIACSFAVVAQFYPLPFPQSRPLLGVCCAGYFVFSGILQLVVKFIERDAIIITKPKGSSARGLRVRTAFPRYQSEFTVIVQFDEETEASAIEEAHCVGKFFDADGYFWEQGFIDTVQKLLARFESAAAKKTN